MTYIFEITDKTGRKIHLTKERWEHITLKHSNMSDKLEQVKQDLINPLLIVPHKFDDTMRNYYRYYKERKQHLKIIVKYLNGGGFIISAYFVREII